MSKPLKNAKVLWIDADPVFGGSRSQVQFPAEVSSFFALPPAAQKKAYEMRSVLIAGVQFPEKKMDFHHNDVWRLNLPTPNQGLGGYEHRVLVFEKTADKKVYRLSVVDKGSPLGRKLLQLAKTEGQVGNRSRDDGTRRDFGFF
jgi:hypothetical protein